MTRNDGRLGVVVAAWNRLELTRSCLASLSQTAPDLPVVLVDDGSHDCTADMVRAEFPDVEVIRHRDNRGVTAAWNSGLGRLSTERICVLNNDLVVEPGCLQRLDEALDTPWVGVASPETPMPADEIVPDFMEASRPPATESPEGAWRVGFAGWCFLFRRCDFPEGFDRRFRLWYQDKDFLYTLLFRRRGVPPFRWPVPGKVPVVVPGARVRHEYHGSHGSLDPEWVSRRTQVEKRRFNRKWRGFRGNRWAREVPWGKEVWPTPPDARLVAEAGGETGDRLCVSVVIPYFAAFRDGDVDERSGDLLRDTLRSVAAQKHRPLEILVVDDASRVDSLPVVEDLLSGFTGSWKLVRQGHNAGPGIARRRGLELARGDYVRFLDADDLLAPGAIDQQVAFLQSRPELVMTYARTHAFEGDSASSELLGRTDQDHDRILPEILRRMIWTTSSCLWRRSALRPENWRGRYAAEDVLFDFLVGLGEPAIARTPGDEPLVLKRQHTESVSASVHGASYQMEILRAYDAMADALGDDPRWRREVARLYDGKVMTFLVVRRYQEAIHCVRRGSSLDRSAVSLDARIAASLAPSVGFWILGALRRWRWLGKLAARSLRARRKGA